MLFNSVKNDETKYEIQFYDQYRLIDREIRF